MTTRTHDAGGRTAPDGSELDLRTGAVPAAAAAVADRAVAAGRAAGVKRTLAVWAEGGGSAGIWVSMHRPSPAALDAVVAAVSADDVPVRVLDIGAVDPRTREQLLQGITRAREATEGPSADRLLTGRQELVVLVVALLGSVVLVLGRRSGSAGTVVAGAVLLAVVLVGVVVAGARGGALRRSPVLLLGGAVVAGLLAWQAVRGLPED